MQLKPSEFVVANQDVRTGDIITFLDEGSYNPLPQDPSREVLTFLVQLPSGEKKKMSVNNTSEKELVGAWCPKEELQQGIIDSKHWVGKKAEVEIVRQKVFQQMKDVIYLHSAEGKPMPTSEEEIPVIE